jgi:hypothetical protein
VLGGVVVDELGVAEVAPLELPEVVESLADSEVELGLVPLSADRLQPNVPKARKATRAVELTVRVIFREFIGLFLDSVSRALHTCAERLCPARRRVGWRLGG